MKNLRRQRLATKGHERNHVEGRTHTEHFQTSIHCFEQVHDRRHACVARQNLGFILIELGDYRGAEQVLRAALAIGERMGLHEAVAYTLVNLGLALGYLGAFEEGRHTQTRVIEAAQRYHHPRLEGLAYVYLATLERLSGDALTSEKHAKAALTLLSDVPTSLALAYAVFARALLMQGRGVEALSAARKAYALLESLGTIEEGEVTVRLVYAEALEANGERPGAAQELQIARAHIMAKAEKISNADERQRFLTAIADNARVLGMTNSINPAPAAIASHTLG